MMGGEHINYDCFSGLLEVLWQGAHRLHLLMLGTEKHLVTVGSSCDITRGCCLDYLQNDNFL